jgi:alpha-mannosidase
MNVYRHQIRYTADKIARRMVDVAACIYRQRLPLDIQTAAGDDPEGARGWYPIRPGETWGGCNEWRWFRAQVAIPQAWTGSRVGLFFALGHPSWRAQPEALAFVDGELRQGIDGNHHELLLTERASGGETYTVTMRAWCTMFDEDTTALYQQIFWAADLVLIDMPTRHFYHSAEMALGTARAVDPDRAEYHLLLNALDDAFKQLDLRSPASPEFYKSVRRAQSVLDGQLSKIDGLPAHILATGHGHLDVLWRWRLGNTREKAMHMFANMVQLMEQYPDFHYTQSQPQVYQLVKEDAPHIYEKVKALIRAGRWEPTGGMWIEADCNIPSGESLVRQILYGRQFFRDEFGTDTPILWLPDTFGYSWALPQLIKRSGLKYFMTSKISWNQYNRIPYDSFWWRGIDGTEVLTHFLTAPGDPQFGGATYGAMLTPAELIGTWKNYQQKDRHDEVLTLFGWGDGGGGPTLEMLERADRAKNQAGLLHVKQGSAHEFFERLEADGKGLPTWNGELYLEYHRGTYTSQARSKRANRKAEVLYHRAELAAAIATLVGKPYPHERLREGWRLILLNQVHDVIPGSSIREVYEDSMKDYDRITEIGEAVLNESIEAIAEHLPLAEGEQGLLLLHSAGMKLDMQTASVPAEWLPDEIFPVDTGAGTPLAVQRSNDHAHISTRLYHGIGWQLFRLEKRESGPAGYFDQFKLTAAPTELENNWLRVTFNELGEIVSLFDKMEERELIPTGAVANQLQAFEDRPARWDSWDIDISYEDKVWLASPQSINVIENGPLRATLEVRKQILNSQIVQRISLEAFSYRIDFHTVIEWRERHVLLKVAFPVNILSPRATFDIQFGNVERPTHYNTSWDWARFESVAHKWVDLSEENYGVSLLNDCKYGHDVHDNVMRLSLLRAPTFPDPEADQGEQSFTYSMLPHEGNCLDTTIMNAYHLNDPVSAFVIKGGGGNRFSANQNFLWIPEHFDYDLPIFVIIETVKGAEDGRGIIVRLHETLRYRNDITLVCTVPLVQAWETNLMEEDELELPIGNSARGQEIKLHFAPFQIRTIRLIPA